MTFRVINFNRQEILAELADVKQALLLCDQLAQESGYQESFGVLLLSTVYETRVEKPA